MKEFFEVVLEFIEEKIILLLILSALAMIIVLYFKNRDIFQDAVRRMCSFSRREYDSLCKDSNKHIINSPLTFLADACDNEEEFDDLYVEPVNLGVVLAKKEKFIIPEFQED